MLFCVLTEYKSMSWLSFPNAFKSIISGKKQQLDKGYMGEFLHISYKCTLQFS